MRDDVIHDRIIVGSRDRELSKKLQLCPTLTLQRTMEMVSTYGITEKQQQIQLSSTVGASPEFDLRVIFVKIRTSKFQFPTHKALAIIGQSTVDQTKKK